MSTSHSGFEAREPDPYDDPPPHSQPGAGPRSVWRSPRFTALLAVLVVVLLAILIAPALNLPRIVFIFDEPSSPPASASAPAATPSPSSAPSPTASPAGSPTFVRPTPTPAPTFLSYVVQPGDSLGSIARAYGTTARSIAWWNRGTYPSLDPESPDYEPDRIIVGWILVLIPGVIVDDANPPTLSPGPATPSPSPTEEVTPSPVASQ